MLSKGNKGYFLIIAAVVLVLVLTGCNPSTTMTEAESQQAAKTLYASLGISTQLDEATRDLAARGISASGTVGSDTAGYVTFTFSSDLTYGSDYEDEVSLGVTCELTFEDFQVSYIEGTRAYEYVLNGKALAVFSLFAFDGSGTVSLALVSGDDLVIEGEDLYNLLNAELLYSVTADLTSSGFDIAGSFEGTVNGHAFTAADTSLTFSYEA